MTLRRSHRLLTGVAVIALMYMAGCAYMWATQRAHIFEPAVPLQTTPDRLGMNYQDLHIPVGSGADKGVLQAWWVPAEHSPAPTFLYLHGNDRNLASHLVHTLHLHRLGYNVLVSDYRGYGNSTGGNPSEAKVYEDAEAAWQYLVEVRGIKPQKIFIYGHSLGGAIAINLAVHHPEAAGLITESTFTSMQAMGELEYGYLPVGLLLNQRFDSLKKIASLKIPVLLIHGTWDARVPVAMAKQLYDAAPQPKAMLLIKGGEHSNSSTIGWIEYRDTVTAFVNQYTH